MPGGTARREGADRGWERTALHVRRVLGEHKLLIVVITAAFAAVALFFDSIAPRGYVVTASLHLQSPAEEAGLLGARVPTSSVSEGEALQIARDPRVVKRALDAAGPALVEPLRHDLAVAPSVGFRVVNVTAVTNQPKLAAPFVDIYATTVADAIRQADVKRLDRLIARLARERLPDRPRDPVRTLVNFRADKALDRLRLIRRVARPAVQITPATIPHKRQPPAAAHVGPLALFGFCLALVVAFLADVVARRPRDLVRLTEIAGLPLAGAIPRLRRNERAASSFDLLRAAVADAGATQTVIVTSSAPGEGKSTVAMGLAEAFARAGRRTCLVEADLRSPALADRIGVPDFGLGDVVRGSADLDDALTEVETGPGAARFSMLTAGHRLRRPAEALRAFEGGLLSSLGARFEAVIVDTPPVLAVADAWPLFAQASSVLLCVRVGATASDELAASCAILERLVPDSARLIVNDVRGEAARGVAAFPPASAMRILARRRGGAEREPAGTVS